MEQALYKAAILTFEEFGFMFPTLELNETELNADNGAAISVIFSGDMNGQLVLLIERRMLPVIAANIRGDEAPFELEMQRDALGEIANGICGNTLPAIAGHKALFRLDAPQFMSTSQINENPDAIARLELEVGRADVLLYLNK